MWLVQGGDPSVVSPRKKTLSPRNVPIGGAVIPSKYSANNGRGFSRFEYQSDPYDITERARRGTSRPGTTETQPPAMSPRPVFKHSSLPAAPQQAGAFQRFRYSEDPFELAQEHKRMEARKTASKAIGGAFSAGGNARNEKRTLKRRMPELRVRLLRELRSDWPSFLQIQLDERGVLLALFNADRLDAERRADLHSYMNRLVSTHPASAEFGLNRDPMRWGALVPLMPAPDADGVQAASAPSQALVYALRPPWVANDLLLAHRLISQKPSALVATAAEPAP